MRKILLIDDKKVDLEIMQTAINNVLNDLNEKKQEIVLIKQILIKNNENNIQKVIDQLNGLMTTIKTAIDEEQKLLIVIDLNLVGEEVYNDEQLKVDSTSGIIVKRYIEAQLDNDQMTRVKFLFISNYLRRESAIKTFLVEQLIEENIPWVVKPTKKLNNEFVKGEVHNDEKKVCPKQFENHDLIQKLYDLETTYGDFLGTILEKAMS